MAVALIAPVSAVSQGDVLKEVPSVYVKSLSWMVKTGDNSYRLSRDKPASVRAENVAQTNVREEFIGPDDGDPLGNAVGARRYGMVLSHGCEIDKPTKHPSVLVAQVRSMSGVTNGVESIRNYDQKRTFYLPPNDFLAEEMYVDFRVVTTLHRAGVIDDLDRIASLNEDGVLRLQEQLFRFFLRRSLPEDWTEWPEEDN